MFFDNFFNTSPFWNYEESPRRNSPQKSSRRCTNEVERDPFSRFFKIPIEEEYDTRNQQNEYDDEEEYELPIRENNSQDIKLERLRLQEAKRREKEEEFKRQEIERKKQEYFKRQELERRMEQERQEKRREFEKRRLEELKKRAEFEKKRLEQQISPQDQEKLAKIETISKETDQFIENVLKIKEGTLEVKDLAFEIRKYDELFTQKLCKLDLISGSEIVNKKRKEQILKIIEATKVLDSMKQ